MVAFGIEGRARVERVHATERPQPGFRRAGRILRVRLVLGIAPIDQSMTCLDHPAVQVLRFPGTAYGNDPPVSIRVALGAGDGSPPDAIGRHPRRTQATGP